MNWCTTQKVAAILGLSVAVGAVAAVALATGTPDGQTPARETVCDGLTGPAFGLCNAYCEAQDCDVQDRPSCDQLRRNFEKRTDTRIFPCEGGGSNSSGEPS